MFQRMLQRNEPATPETSTTAPSDNGDSVAKNQDNNAGVSDDDLSNIWSSPEPQEPQTPETPGNFDEYVNNLDLGITIDPHKFAESLNNGNTEVLNDAFKQVGTKIYKQVVKDMGEAVQQMLTRQSDTMRREFGDMYKSRTIEQQIDQKFPGLKNAKAVRPVFLAAAQQMQSQGKSDEQIITAIDALAKQFAQQSPTAGEANQFSRPASQQQPEWLSILTGKE